MLFVDLVKTFDTTNHELLMKVLTKHGMLMDVIPRMYAGLELQFYIGSTEKIVPYTIGNHGNITPIHFNLFFRDAVESLGVLWERSIPTPEFHWFPCDRGRLQR